VVDKKYIDVNVFIYWLGAHPKYGKRAKKWIKEVEKSGYGEYVTSSLTLYEIAVILSGLTGTTFRDHEFIKTVMNAINSLKSLKIISLEDNHLIDAVKLMEEYKLDYEDALHLAVALKASAEEIVTNDSDFDRTPLRRLF